MPRRHHPKRGSMAYSPRKRAKREVPKIKHWPEGEKEPRIQGFAGYKAGMTHAFVVDYRPTSTTAKQEVQIPVTIIETPPMKVVAIRFYENTYYGLKTITEIWADKIDKELVRRISIPEENRADEKWKIVENSNVDEVRILAHTQPKLVTGVPKKKPELIEIRVGGGSIEERIEYAKSILGKEIDVTHFAKDGKMIDVTGVTKGKGFQGAVKRWGIKILSHKDSKRRRQAGTLGPWTPSYVMREVPQAGQVGYHQRTEFNKRILKVGESGEEITPKGGFLHYGVVRNKYLIIHGSVPGPAKRLIRLRDPIRLKGVEVEKPDLTYVSLESKQGV